MVERLRDGPAVRVVVPPAWIVVVWLVGVEVRQRRDGVRVWVELRSRVGRGGGRVSERTSPCFRIKAGPARAVCWQGDDVVVVGVELWPLNLLVCDFQSKMEINTRRDRSEGWLGCGNTYCYQSRPASGSTSTRRSQGHITRQHRRRQKVR